MDIQKMIDEWIAVGNSYNTEKYLTFYLPEAILDDPSVGRKFEGHAGIQDYFENYFIDYKTQTELVLLNITAENQAHLEVEFTGEFPEGKIGGTFDFTFKNNKIAFVKADLLQKI